MLRGNFSLLTEVMFQNTGASLAVIEAKTVAPTNWAALKAEIFPIGKLRLMLGFD
jgi:hypothetical protein